MYGERIDFVTKVQRNYPHSGDRLARTMTTVLYLDQEKFKNLILENTEFNKEGIVIFNYPQEFALPKK